MSNVHEWIMKTWMNWKLTRIGMNACKKKKFTQGGLEQKL